MTKRTGIAPMLAASLMMVVLPACTFTQEHPGLATGAGIGAAGGAIAGGLITGGRRGMLWGALAGALVGGAIGAYKDSQDKTAAETNATHSYTPEKGVQLQMESVAAEPQSATPGQDVSLKATYAIMAPDPQQQIEIKETRTITLNGQNVANTEITVVRAPGTRTSTVPITLPDNAKAGTYELKIAVSTGEQSSSMTTTFTVQ